MSWRGAASVSAALNADFDPTTPMGRAFLQIQAAFAEMERNVIRQRVKEGLAAACARGRKGGRPRRMTPERLRSEMGVRNVGRAAAHARVARQARPLRQGMAVKTVMSMVKRRCGEALTARLDEMQRARALLRGVAYNVQCLVRVGAAA